MGCLHTHMGLPALLPEPFVHSKIALRGALQCLVRRGSDWDRAQLGLPMPHGVWVRPSILLVRPWLLLADWKRLQERARRDGLVSVDDLPLPVDTLDSIDILACREEYPLIGEHMDGD